MAGPRPRLWAVTIQLLMPFWGEASLFRIAVESVLAQHDPDWRLLVVDDRYPGTGHLDVLDELADPRIGYVLNERNLGVSGNFQRCAELATGPWATIFGVDDVLLPGYVGRVRSLADAFPDASVIQPGVEVIDDAGRPSLPLPDRVKRWYRPKEPRVVLEGEDLAVSLLRGDWTYFPSLLWSVAFLRSHPFRAGLEVVQDLTLKLDVAFDGGSMVVDSEPVFQYRRHRTSVSSLRAVDGSRFLEERELFARAAERSEERGWPRARRAAALHSSSRLNAVSRIPQALQARDLRGVGLLTRHALGGRSSD